VFWFLLICGIAALAAAVLEFRAVVRLRRHGRRVQGTVIDNVPTTSRGSKLWVPIVGFTDHLGYPVEFALRVHTSWKRRVDRNVPVIYLPDKPHDARMDSWVHLWLGVVLLLVIGTVLVVLAVGQVLQPGAKAGM
jgi:Protein of unknown function (DUF3592)